MKGVDRRAMMKVWKQSAQHLLECQRLLGLGLSDQTIEALVACGIHDPERLLLMTEDQLRHIPGIGKPAMTQINRYRKRFAKVTRE